MEEKDLKFFANVVRCFTENDVITLGLSDSDFSPDKYVIITYFGDDIENLRDGDDGIGIQTNLSIRENSSAISKIIVGRDFLNIFIRSDKTKIVGVSKIEIKFSEEKNYQNEIRDYLEKILMNSDAELYRVE
jgi:hypothetical protein